MLPGEARRVTLRVPPEFRSVVLDSGARAGAAFYSPPVVVEQGAVGVFVGGGQPGAGPGYFGGGLRANVTVSARADLSTC
jgi:hypothetical protein